MNEQGPACVEERIDTTLQISRDAMISRHNEMLRSITSSVSRSAIYSGRVKEISSLEDLSGLPLTSYQDIDAAVERLGQEKCLLQTPDHIFQTSGSTGSPKRMYYSKGDALRMATDFAVICRSVGVRKEDTGWNLGGARPNVSGALLEETSELLDLQVLHTLLTRESDLMPAMRKASRLDRIDVVASAALVLYFISRSVREPDFLQSTVRDKLKRDKHLPSLLASAVARLYIKNVNPQRLGRMLAKTRLALTYAEPITGYYSDYRGAMPEARFVDVLGSTENPVLAAQMELGNKGLSLFLNAVIPELADPMEVANAKQDGKQVKGVPWTEWQKGMQGELLVTRPGDCLPLIRYPTGDMVEVIDPAHKVSLGDDGKSAVLPLIKVLGRSVDVLDFEVEDEMGCFLGNKIYTHNIHEALQRSRNIRWWELYNIKGSPGRLCFLIIPENDVTDVERFKKDVLGHLLKECDDPHHTLEIGIELGRLDLLVTKAAAYAAVQREIDKRAREGRALGQLKPKRIRTVDGEEAFQEAIAEKMQQ